MKRYAILAGGGVKGVALAGCLAASQEKGIRFEGYGGTSAGSIVALLASPAIPDAAAEVWRRIGLDARPTDERLSAAAWGGYPGGLAVVKGSPLFPRIA